MKNSFKQSGFTLIELLVTIGIVGVLAGFAYPAYIGYIDSSCLTTATNNAKTLRVFEENFYLENNTYLAGTHTAGETGSTLNNGLHWDNDDDDRYDYSVTVAGGGNTATITVSSPNCSVDITETFSAVRY